MTDTDETTLGRRVAELVGWRIVHPEWMGEGHYELYMPDGRMMYVGGHGVFNDDDINDALPDYEHDLNACVRDLAREGYVAHLMQTVDGWRVWFAPVYTDGQLTVYGKRIDETEREGKNPAVAWCEAFKSLCAYIAELEATAKE